MLRYDFGGKSKGYPNVAQRLKTIPLQAQERVALEQQRNYLNNRVSELESEKETIADERDLLAKKLEETLVIEEEKFISIYFEHQDVDNGVEKSRITFNSNGIVKDTQNEEARRVDVSWIVRKSATK